VRWFGVGKPVTTSAVELGVSAAAIHNWVRQDQIDRGAPLGSRRPGVSSWRKRGNAFGSWMKSRF